ncbi:MAG: molybdopterin molybdotransferase MoeA [Candidatus Coatesbacteria bacterium]|nr:molybdopterin molybdotransferase MoeA [Candidatus Coatesbacteria bacterium]
MRNTLSSMIPREEAFSIVMGLASLLRTEHIPLEQALGRVLAEDVLSDIDMPPFDKSAMDGYAIRREDILRELEITEVIPAGTPPSKRVGPGECAKIMTGAMIPEGADCVIMREYVELTEDGRVRFTGNDTATNICYKAEDTSIGDVVLRRGERILPQQVAILASLGCMNPLVARRPRVGIMATGDELVEPRERPGVSQIRNSNSYQLQAQAAAAGAIPKYFGIAEDTEAAIDATLKKVMAESDVVLVSGGVSVGDYDLVPAILRRNGVEMEFESLAIKPGKPTHFGLADGIYFFGLPGNPVSTFVIFELLVKPFLLKLMGHDYRPANIVMPLEQDIEKHRTKREAWYPVVLTSDGCVRPIEYHGSAHARALPQADGIICVPRGTNKLAKGEMVHVRMI